LACFAPELQSSFAPEWGDYFSPEYSKTELHLHKTLNQIEKTYLLILDDFELHPMDKIAKLTLLQIFEDQNAK